MRAWQAAIRGLVLLLAMVWLAGFSGCATFSETSSSLQGSLARGQPELALLDLEKAPGGRESRVLYLMNRGMLLRLAGDFAASNEALEEAKGLIDKLTALSISEQTAALSVNDAQRSYLGEPYERVLLYFYKALNSLALGDHPAARVEVLQADLVLGQFTANERKIGAEGPMRYLSGLIFEQGGEWSDALIAYRKAFEAYRSAEGIAAVPRPLREDLLRLAQRQGLEDEVERYRDLFGLEDRAVFEPRRDRGEVIVILGSGLVPVKGEQALNMLNGGSGHWYRIAAPFYPPRRTALPGAIRVTADQEVVMAAPGEDIDLLARRALDAAMPGITARALARMVVKGSAAREVGRNDQLLGALVNIAAVVSERADTRAWITLPAQLHFARLSLAPGLYEIKVEWLGPGGGSLMTRTYREIEVRPEAVAYIQDHWIGP